jgi:hypothetical protein
MKSLFFLLLLVPFVSCSDLYMGGIGRSDGTPCGCTRESRHCVDYDDAKSHSDCFENATTLWYSAVSFLYLLP